MVEGVPSTCEVPRPILSTDKKGKGRREGMEETEGDEGERRRKGERQRGREGGRKRGREDAGEQPLSQVLRLGVFCRGG